LTDKKIQLNNILSSFKIGASCIEAFEGRNADIFDLSLLPRTKIKHIQKFLPELSLALRISSDLFLTPIIEKGIVRLTSVKKERELINFFSFGQNIQYPKGVLSCLLGEKMNGDPMFLDLVDCPHLLIAGATGSGKSTLLHTLIANLLLHPTVNLYLCDPKNIEFADYENSNISRINISFDLKSCIHQLSHLYNEMEDRYKRMKEEKINAFHFPRIVFIIDEFSDLILQDETGNFRELLCKLAQKSRAAGIHLILGTQRPSVSLLDGAIKANFPARIACRTSSHIDSRVILDQVGAEKLLGKGDALIKSPQFDLERFQIARTKSKEIIYYFAQ
jgi:DNA segregation ATPase FtsK/SpoIIIE, S-DNA-T family